MSRRRRYNGTCRRPFTLLEVLIASAILAGVAALMLMASNAIMTTWSKLTEENREFSGLLAVDRTLENMFGNVVAFRWPKEDAEVVSTAPENSQGDEQPLWFGGEPSSVRFCYQHELNSLEDGALRFVELSVEDDALVANYLERPVQAGRKSQDVARQAVLASDVVKLELQYADWGQGNQDLNWSDQWDAERNQLPLAIWMRVTWANGRDESWLFRMPGCGYAERLGKWQPK